MRVKFNNCKVIDFSGTMISIKLTKECDVWYIIVSQCHELLRDYKFLVGKDGDTVLNQECGVLERVEKIAENEISFAFLNGFLDLSDYEEVNDG